MKTIDMEQALRLCKEGEECTPQERKKLVKERLKQLVAYAREHSPYFREAYQEVGEDFDLEDLPVTSKELLMKEYDRWVTDPAVTYADVKKYAGDTENTQKPYLGKYTALTTSGTTGVPMHMVRDAYHNTIHGVLMQTRLLRNVDPDIMTPVRHRVAALIFPDPAISSYSSFLRMKNTYPDYAGNMLVLSVSENVDVIVDKLNAFQPDFVSGYPSVMALLAKASNEGRLKIHPQAVACSAEMLTEKVYRALKGAFGCPVLNNYCSTEGGEAAMSCEEGKLHINDDWVIIEPVDKEGKPVPLGELSDGIYITDLTNYVLPIIRYHMKDRVRILPEMCGCGSTLPAMEIEGRSCENIIIGDRELFGIRVEHLLMYIEGVYSIQLIQKAERSFEVRMVPCEEGMREKAFEKAKELLLGYFEDNGCTPVEIISSDAPPILNKRGGKMNFFVRDDSLK